MTIEVIETHAGQVEVIETHAGQVEVLEVPRAVVEVVEVPGAQTPGRPGDPGDPGPAGYAAQVSLGSISGATPVDVAEAIDTDVTATLTGNTTLSFTNVRADKSTVTLFLAQDGTGGRTLTHPSGTDFFSGQDGSINEDAGAVSVVTYITLDGGTTWLAAVTDERTVTSVDISVPTGLSVSGNPISSSGTLAVTYSAGYSLPLTTDTAKGVTAESWGDHSLAGYATQTWVTSQGYKTTDTTYTAGDGLSLNSGEFSVKFGTGATEAMPGNTSIPSTASDVGAVPTSRTVNGKALSSNISINAADVGARADNWVPSGAQVAAFDNPPPGTFLRSDGSWVRPHYDAFGDII